MEKAPAEIMAKINELEANLSDLKKRWPAHSLKPDMFAQLEALEDELEYYKKLLQDSTEKEG